MLDLEKVYDLTKILKKENKGNYDTLIDNIISFIDENINNREIKVKVKSKKLKKNMYLCHFLTNLILLRPIIDFDSIDYIDKYIWDNKALNDITSQSLSKYFSMIIEDFLNDSNYYDVCDCVASIIENLGILSSKFNVYLGNTISIRSLIELSEKNKKFDDIIHTKVPKELPLNEKESYIQNKTDRLVEILKTEDNCLKNYLLCKEGINIKQLSQMCVCIGMKPDLKGGTIPICIDSNYLQGLQNSTEYYIDAAGGRKAEIMNFSKTKTSGYFNRKLCMLCIGVIFARDIDGNIIDDCGSTDYVSVDVKDKKVLSLIDKKYIKQGDSFHTVNSSKDEDLIGTTVKMRSPITCKCKHGICKKCYGDLYKINQDIHIGILGVEELTSRLTQRMLSSKHLLTTHSENIQWGDDFLQVFNIDANSITINNERNWSDSYIVIDKNIIGENEDYEVSYDDNAEDAESEFGHTSNLKQYITEFTILTKKKKAQDVFMDIKSPKRLYLSEEFEKILVKYSSSDSDKIEIPIKNFSQNDTVFYFMIDNNELSKSLSDIIALVDVKDHLGETTIDGMINKFLELLKDSNIMINSVHIENIIRELIRDKDNLQERPKEFNNPENYTILRVVTAILNSPSISKSLSFESLKKQLLNPETFSKDGRSFFDHLF